MAKVKHRFVSGQRIGRWIVLREVGYLGKDRAWECICDCDNVRLVRTANLVRGSRSCGCLGAEKRHNRLIHGMSKSKEYRIWQAIKARCENPKNKKYHCYGGRGITVCTRWQDFANFFLDMGLRPVGHEIDRINNSSGYEPGNCRWATRKQNMRNTSRIVSVTYENQTHSLVEWSEIKQIPYRRLRDRIQKLGWEPGRALRP